MRRSFILLTISFGISFAQNWITELIEYDNFINDCSITTDTMNYPHIAFAPRTPSGSNLHTYFLKYARWNGGYWQIQVVDSSIGSSGHLACGSLRIQIDNQQHPHIAYVTGTLKFKYAYYDGDHWQISLIDSTNTSRRGNNQVDMVLSQEGIPHISYPFTGDSWGLRYAVKSGDTWIIHTLWKEAPPLDSWPSNTAIDLNRSGHPAITFESRSSEPRSLLCARFNGQTWEFDTVTATTGYLSIYSLRVDDFDRPHIFFQQGIFLYYAVEEANTWRIESLRLLNGSTFPDGDMVLEGSTPRVVFSSHTTYVVYHYKKDTLWQTERIANNSGRSPRLAMDGQGNIHASYCIQAAIPETLYYARRITTAIEEEKACPIYKSRLPKELFLTISSPVSASSNLRLSYGLPKDERVRLAVYDLSGRTAMVLKDEIKKAGYYSEAFNFNRLSNGIYWLVLKSGGETKTRKLVLIK